MKKFKKVILILLIYICGLLMTTNSNAASANISANKTSVNVGETVTITVRANAAAWEIHITGAVSGNYADTSDNGENTSVTKTLTFTPKAEGTYTIKMSGNVSDGSNNAITSIGGSITIIAKASTSNNNGNNSSNSGSSSNTNTVTKSNVATLSNLGIRPNDFSGFSANKTSYSTEVPNNVESIEIYANKGQSGQTITGTGKKTLKEGTNTFSIVVTAEDGKTQKTYTINVTRKTKDDNSTENETTEETTNETASEDEIEDPTASVFGLTKLSIAGVELQPQFQTDVYEYRIELKENLDKLDIEAIATEENANVEITGNENLQDGENVITILVKGDTEDKNVAYQIIVNKSVENQEETNTNANKIKNIIIVSTVAGLILIVIIIIVVSKIKNKKNKAFIPYGGVFENNDVDENDSFEKSDNIDVEENNNVEEYEEEKPKKKRSKGKRFK